MQVPEEQIHAMIGDDGFDRLVARFYAQVPSDDILGPMYSPADLAAAPGRLRDFLIGRFGGPNTYVASRGHPRLRMRHAPFPITPAARDRWMQLMVTALEEANFPPAVTATLRRFFAESATFLINRP